MKKLNRIINGKDSLFEALLISAKKNKKVIFLAQGVDDPTSMYGTMSNLKKYINDDRIIEMPVSENAMVSAGIGAALFDNRPIISLHRVEFALLAIEQIINNAAKAHYVSYGAFKVPMVIRLIVGKGWGQGPKHSQSLENLFSIIPGLKVLTPSLPIDLKGMTIAAIEDNNPVIIIEHRWSHYVNGNVPKGYYKSQILKPVQLTKGIDLTLVSNSITTIECIQIVKTFKEFNILISHFDLRVCRPLNLIDIIKSVKKTKNFVCIDLGSEMFGIGSEMCAIISVKCFEELKLPPIKIGMPDYPTPSSRGYLEDHYPDKKNIALKILKYLKVSNELKKTIMIKINKDLSKNIDVPNDEFKGPF
jgi:acetoin:2,6-dichlorophenolindophenol oxidoreductase subunit beta